MKPTAVFFIFSCFSATILSFVISPLLTEYNTPLLVPLNSQLDRTFIELCLNSELLHAAPQEYQPFIKWLFRQPALNLDDFDFMVEKNLISLEIADIGFATCIGFDQANFLLTPFLVAITNRFINTFIRYIKAFDEFHPEFIIISQIFIGNVPGHNSAKAILNLVEERKGEYSRLISREVAQYAIKGKIDISMSFCCFTMLESDWLTLEDLTQLLWSFETYNIGEEMTAENKTVMDTIFAKAKSFIVDEESAFIFIRALPEFWEEINDLLRWIAAQPWVTSELINEMILHEDNENSIDFELILHEKATFACVESLKVENFDLLDHLLIRVYERIVEIIRRDANREQLFRYIARIPLQFEDHSTTRVLVQYILESEPDFFMPHYKFFSEFSKAYAPLSVDDQRKPRFVLTYLTVLFTKMNTEDLDCLLEFAFASRPFELGDEWSIWTEIAESVLRLSFNKSQKLVHMAKNDNDSLSIFGEVHDITNCISQLAIAAFEQTLAELKQAHNEGDQYIQKLSKLGKYERVFLMLTAPTISKLYTYTLKSLNPSYAFMRSARRLSIIRVDQRISDALSVSTCYKAIREASVSSSIESIENWPVLIAMLKSVFRSNEHAGFHWMVRDIAEMVLECPNLDKLPLFADDIEFLRMVARTSGPKRKKSTDADTDEDLAGKRQRKN